ncbi:MAG: ATP-binding cassette domain-containing protein [Agriterribacter sp.]
MDDFFLRIEDVTVRSGEKEILKKLNLNIKENEYWAIVGASGSGKTTLANTLSGKHYFTGNIQFNSNAKPNIVVVEQQHRFKNLSNVSDFYYQQRYNSSGAEDTITVKKALEQLNPCQKTIAAGIEISKLPGILHITHVMDEPLIQLSNGENKRLQIAKAILQEPKLLILDNPFVGLDVEGRKILANIIDALKQAGVKILLITSPFEVPDSITHVAVLENGTIIAAAEKNTFDPHAVQQSGAFRIDYKALHALKKDEGYDFEYAIRMKNVVVKYGDRIILDNINWDVKNGECWSISGPNGAGKSTLLSLITGDNAKAYANEVYLFDKRRGTGESIWDIKKKIGYLSPEMHIYFDYTSTVFQTIASGLFDSIGLFRQLNDEQRKQANEWMSLLKLEKIQNKLLSQLSAGEQRLVLLARALVKNPPVLILDEPCQGLDSGHIEAFRQIISDICQTFGTTLLYVSHYKHEIPECVTKALYLNNGEMRVENT